MRGRSSPGGPDPDPWAGAAGVASKPRKGAPLIYYRQNSSGHFVRKYSLRVEPLFKLLIEMPQLAGSRYQDSTKWQLLMLKDTA